MTGRPASGGADRPFLSIVVPAHDEEARLPGTLAALDAFVAEHSRPGHEIEVLVVENASRDRTAAIALAAARERPWLRVLREARRGKGAAVRTGMLAARGRFRFFADADFSMPVAGLLEFLPPRHAADYDVAIGSREAPGARRIGEPWLRHAMGRAFNLWVRLVALGGIQDSQCGFKCFRGEAAEEVFRLQRVEDWSFDVEVLLLARQLGLRIVEVPVEWHYRAESRVRAWRDAPRMALAVLSIRRRLGRTRAVAASARTGAAAPR